MLRRWRILFCLLALVAAAELCAETWLARGNTLYDNGRWDSTKTRLARGVMGAVAYVVARPALSRDRLDLGAYFGEQELLYREPLRLKELSCRVEVDDDAAVTVIFGKGARGFSGLRLSRSERLDSGYFTATADGEFLTKVPLPAGLLQPGWNRFRMAVVGARIEFYVGERLVLTQAVELEPGQVGFRGSIAPARIDDVRITPESGPVIVETFGNHRHWLPALGVALAALLLLAWVAWLAGVPLLASSVVFAFFAFGVHLTDRFFLSTRYPPEASIEYHDFKSTFESSDQVAERIRRTYARGDVSRSRILFLGTSQTWGAGAQELDDVYVRRVEERLDGGAKPPRFQCINAGVSAVRSEDLLVLFEREWLSLAPKLVVVDLSNNDSDLEGFRRNLETVVRLDRERGIATLFVLEPNAPELRELPVLGRHQVMREVAGRLAVPLVDLQELLNQRRNDGFLFWDFVHLTSFGHRLTAALLVPEIRKLLPTK